MSKERMNDVSMNSELLDLESSLKGLSAAGNVNRDELLFEAGRRSANHRATSLNRFWKGVSTALALTLAGQSFVFWPSDDKQLADDNSPRAGSTSREDEIPPDYKIKPANDSTMNTLQVNQENLPTRRSELLQLRRVALTQGLDAAFSYKPEKNDLPSGSQATRQELLRELLGS